MSVTNILNSDGELISNGICSDGDIRLASNDGDVTLEALAAGQEVVISSLTAIKLDGPSAGNFELLLASDAGVVIEKDVSFARIAPGTETGPFDIDFEVPAAIPGQIIHIRNDATLDGTGTFPVPAGEGAIFASDGIVWYLIATGI